MEKKPAKKRNSKANAAPVRALTKEEATQVKGGKSATTKLMEACATGAHIKEAT